MLGVSITPRFNRGQHLQVGSVAQKIVAVEPCTDTK